MSATQSPRLSQKRIRVTFVKVGTGNFAGTGKNTLTISGLRASANISKIGGAAMGTMQLSLFGMTQSHMNDLATLGLVLNDQGGLSVLDNQIIVEAGDDDTGMAIVHHGTINNAWTDLNAMPEVAFYITSFSGLYEAALAVPPTSYSGMVDVSTIMSSIANLAGWNFQNDGVTTKMENVYHPGSPWDQMQQVKAHANINAFLDDGAPKTLVIWPKGKTRGGAVALISKTTGMIGSPSYRPHGTILVNTRFNPSINFGQQIKLESDLPQANGQWEVFSLTHNLDAEIPHGAWETRLEAQSFEKRGTPQIRTQGP